MDLKVVAGNAAGTTLPVERELEIGRAAPPPGDLAGDPAISRRHARLFVTGAGMLIEDLGSSNGTFINGERLTGERLLKAGDVVQVGDTTLQFGQPPPPPLAGKPALGEQAPTPGERFEERKKLDPRVPVLGVLALLLAAVAAFAFITRDGDDGDTATAAAGAAGADVAGWLYVISNDPEGNEVLVVDRRPDGSLGPVHVREFPTGGDGAELIRGRSLGALAGDSQVTLNQDQTRLFAVNQGSDNVAVFDVDRATGALEAVEGSPFPSGGKAPTTTGFNGRQLVVVNHGILPGEEIPGDPGRTNYALFEVSEDGRLDPVNTVEAPGAGPTAAVFANDNVVFSTGFYSFAIDGLRITDNGMLRRAEGMPQQFPESIVRGVRPPPGESPDIVNLPYGIAVHPERPLVYVLGATANRIAVYRYDERSGAIDFVAQAENPDTGAQCWARITRDGRFLFTGNSGSQDISAFRISEDGEELTRVDLEPSRFGSTIANLALSADDRVLYALGTAASPDAPPDIPATTANTIESFAIGDDGSLEPIDSIALPLPITAFPAGLGIVDRAP